MAKKALLIANIDTADINNTGITHKLSGQAKGLSSCGYSVDIISNLGNQVILNSSKIHQIKGPALWNKLNWYKSLSEVGSNHYKLVWLRHHVVTPDMIRFLQKAKIQNKRIKIVLDLPTYPYDQEWSGIRGALALLMDRINSKKLRKFVDLITHSGSEQEIFGIPTVKMTNGIDPSDIQFSQSFNQELTNLMAIAKWQYWHGLDRILRGWQNDESIRLHIVGEGPYLSALKKMSLQNKLKNITYHGALRGAILDQLFMNCDLGIGTLGIHRKGVNINSSLKHREYCSRGVPFIYSGTDPDFDQCNFIQRFEEDDSVITIDSLKRFYDHVRQLTEAKMIRSHAEQNLSWNVKIQHVTNRLMNS